MSQVRNSFQEIKNLEAAVDYYRKATVMGSKEFEADRVVSTGSNSTRHPTERTKQRDIFINLWLNQEMLPEKIKNLMTQQNF